MYVPQTLSDSPFSHCPSAAPLGLTHIPGLDAHFFSTTRHPSSLSSVERGDVIEIQGPPASGKTHLLYFLLINCITPSSYSSIELGGWGKAAIVFDTDGTFDIVHLNRLLLGRLTRLLPSNIREAQEIAKKSLHSLHIFRPSSSSQLATTIIHLPKYHTAHLPGAEIGMLAIDSMSAFYWPDRFTVEQLRLVPAVGETGKVPRSPSPLQHVLTALQTFRVSHGPLIIMTNWGLNVVPTTTSSMSKPATLYRQHLYPFPSLFRNLHPNQLFPSNADTISSLTHHITLSPPSIPHFRQDTPIKDAQMEESDYRQQGIEQGEVMGIVRTPGSRRVDHFVFRITDNDIIAG